MFQAEGGTDQEDAATMGGANRMPRFASDVTLGGLSGIVVAMGF